MWRPKIEVNYQYVKASPTEALEIHVKKPPLLRIIPSLLITLGSVLIANVAWPILSYQIFTAPKLQQTKFIAPIPKELVGNTTFIRPQALNAPSPVLGADLDYTKAQNWFPEAPFASKGDEITNYTLDIPAVDIEKAEVVIGGNNLDKHLIHYPGTANPGQLGSPVIFGHSVLRQFYNPALSNPNRYISIFSKIMTLKTGDRIFVNFDGIKYTYEVKDKIEVKPEDVFILEQRYNNRELKLITCVPEGTYLRRGVIIAQLMDVE